MFLKLTFPRHKGLKKCNAQTFTQFVIIYILNNELMYVVCSLDTVTGSLEESSSKILKALKDRDDHATQLSALHKEIGQVKDGTFTPCFVSHCKTESHDELVEIDLARKLLIGVYKKITLN